MAQIFDRIVRAERLTFALLAAALGACATQSELLNSERIEQRFGSYGIEVLASEAELRRSSLYSVEPGGRVCRTYAVVRFAEDIDRRLEPGHARVLAGNSLGAAFKSDGWDIRKQTLHIGTVHLPADDAEVAPRMRLVPGGPVALHVYQLLLLRDDIVFEYATIIEAHHPEYLSESDLLDIYSYDQPGALDAKAVSEISMLLLSETVN